MTLPQPRKFIEPKDVFRKCQPKHIRRPVYTLGRKIQVVPKGLISLVDGKIAPKEVPGEAYFILAVGQGRIGRRSHHIISNGEHYYNIKWEYLWEQGTGSWKIDPDTRYWLLDTEWQKLIKHTIQAELKNA